MNETGLMTISNYAGFSISNNKAQVSILEKVLLFFMLLVLKILYVVAINLMLPEMYGQWSFYKNVNLNLIGYELIPFTLCTFVMLHFRRKNSAISFFSLFFFIIFFIPINSGLSLSGYEIDYYILSNTYSFLLFLILGFLSKKEKTNNQNCFDFNKIRINKRFLRLMLFFTLLICAICIIYAYSYNGLDFSALFSDMYETRADFSDYVAKNTGSFLSYFVLIFRNITTWFLPVGLYFALVSKKKICVLICFFAYLAVFVLNMEKGTIMIVLVVLFVYFFERLGKKFSNLGLWMTFFLVLFFAASLIENSIRKESFLFSFVIRRIFYIPSYMTKIHYDYFASSTKLWFRQDVFLVSNIVQLFTNRPYSINATGVISKSFFKGLIPSPNAGILAEAYYQMGTIGFFVFPFIHSFIIFLIGKIFNWYGKGASAIAMVVLGLQFSNTPSLPSSSFFAIIILILITFFLKTLYASYAKQSTN